MTELSVRYPTFKSLPVKVKTYIILLQAIFIPVAVSVLLKEPFENVNWLDFFIFTTLGITFLTKPLFVTQKGAYQGIDVFIHFATILLFRPQQVLIIVFLSFLIGDFIARSRSWARLINFSEISLIYYLAALSFNKLKASQPYLENLIINLPSILIAAALILLLNNALHLLVYRFLYKEEPIFDAVKEVISDLLLYELPQIPIGIALATSYHYQRISLILFMLPALIFYATYHFQSQMRLKEQEVEEERKRIEQDAHDRIYNKLGALAKKAELAANSTDAKGEAKQTLNLLQKDLRFAVQDLQKIVSAENKTTAEGSGFLMAELESICQNFKKRSSIDLENNFDQAALKKIDPKDLWHFQCILEECLNNIQKHSKASQVNVSIKNDKGQIILRVQDNGVGIKAKIPASGKGLKGMQERAQKMGALISFIPNNSKGTIVELKLPL